MLFPNVARVFSVCFKENIHYGELVSVFKSMFDQARGHLGNDEMYLSDEDEEDRTLNNWSACRVILIFQVLQWDKWIIDM